MSGKTPVSADVGNSAGYWGVRGSELGWGRVGAELLSGWANGPW